MVTQIDVAQLEKKVAPLASGATLQHSGDFNRVPGPLLPAFSARPQPSAALARA